MSHFCAPVSTTQFKTVRILTVITLSVSFILIGVIGTTSIPQLQSLNQVKPIFKYIFHLMWIFSCIALISFLVATILCWFDTNIIAEIAFVIFGIMCLFLVLDFLLLNLFARLHFTFRDSMFGLSKRTQIIFVTLYCVVLILSCVLIYITSHRIVIYGSEVPITQWIVLPEVFGVTFSIYGVFYLGAAAAATITFAHKLVKLTNISSFSSRDVHSRRTLNKKQLKIIESATRYTSLVDIGIGSGLITSVILVIYGYNGETHWTVRFFHLVFMITSINFLIQVITTYLQYPFATKYYYKYCKCNHLAWRFMLTQKADKMFEKSKRNIDYEMQVASLKANEQKDDSS
eukprot:390837_1